MTTDSALQPFVTHIFTRLPCCDPNALYSADMLAYRETAKYP